MNNRVKTTTMLREVDIAWLAGLVDGEGCIHFGKSTRKHTTMFLDCWLQIAMTHFETVDHAAALAQELCGDPCRSRYKGARGIDRHGYKRRAQKHFATSSKRGCLLLLRALLPYLVTKQLEARLAIAFLERSTKKAMYKATLLDHVMAQVAAKLKQGCGEAPAEALQLLGEVIPYQATGGTGNGDSVEGLQTRSVTPKNNPTHECPAPLRLVKGGDEIVDSSTKVEGEETKNSSKDVA